MTQKKKALLDRHISNLATFSIMKLFCKQNFFKVGIDSLLPKFFWPTVRKDCSSDREKL